MRPVRILMPSFVNPTAVSGAATVTRNLIRALQAPPLHARVDCVAPALGESRGIHRWRQAVSVARSVATSMPAKPAFTYSRRFRHKVMEQLRQACHDLVVLNGGDLLWLLPLLGSPRRVMLIAHNVEHAVFDAQAEAVGRRLPFLRPLLRRERARLQQLETAGMATIANVLFLSSRDAEFAHAHAPASRTLAVPPVFFEPPADRDASGRAAGLVEAGFLGNGYWWPNRDGLRWFFANVFPSVRTRVRLHLFGPGTRQLAPADPNVVSHGSVTDLIHVWNQCDVMICPVFRGGGACVKLAEALYHGVPVLATRFATRGLPLPDDPCLRIVDDPERWCRFLASPEAAELRGRRISPAISATFSGPMRLPAIQRFVLDALHSTSSDASPSAAIERTS